MQYIARMVLTLSMYVIAGFLVLSFFNVDVVSFINDFSTAFDFLDQLDSISVTNLSF